MFFFQIPVILTDTDLVKPALKWTLDYLSDNLGDGDFTVYKSSSHKFKYFDEKRAQGRDDFTPPMSRDDMKFKEFVNKVQKWTSAEKRCKL